MTDFINFSNLLNKIQDFSCFLGKIKEKVYEISMYENTMKTTRLEETLAEPIEFNAGQERSVTGFSGGIGVGRAGYPVDGKFVPITGIPDYGPQLKSITAYTGVIGSGGYPDGIKYIPVRETQPKNVTGFSGAVGLGRACYPRENYFIEVRGEDKNVGYEQ